MKIYLLNETVFEGVENLVLNEIVFYDFGVNLDEFDALLCTSKNALKALKKTKNSLNLDINVYAVGQNTAQFAKDMGFKKVQFAPKSYGSEFFNHFKEELKNQKCLYLRAENIASTLNLDLRTYGVDLQEIIVYKNVFKKSKQTILHPAIFIFTSPLSVENFFKQYDLKKEDKVIAIGQSTAKKLTHLDNLFISSKQDLKECVKLAKSLI
ncbi:uroporphyrinogen-III synthase [Campylobacter coli]